MIVELKAERGNHAALSEAVADLLAHSGADYCVESFDPRVVKWFCKNRPQVCRGQLAENFLANQNSKMPVILKFVLTNLLMNGGTCPDFIAYRFEDRNTLAMRLCRAVWKPVEVSWTIRSRQDMLTAEQEGKTVIFEQFDPQ